MTLKRSLYSLVVVILFFGTVGIAYVFASGSKPLASEDSPQLLGVRQFATWSYWAYEEGHGFVGLYPEVKEYNEAGTATFIEENKTFANELFAQRELVEGIIRFRRPVPLEALPALVEADTSRVREYYLEYTTESGEVVTIGGAPKGDVFLPQDELQTWEAIAATNSGEGTTIGFTRIVMDMTRAEYETLLQEADVWFVDATVEYATHDAIQQGFAGNKEKISVAPLFLYIPTPNARQE